MQARNLNVDGVCRYVNNLLGILGLLIGSTERYVLQEEECRM